MAEGWILQTILSAILSQAVIVSSSTLQPALTSPSDHANNQAGRLDRPEVSTVYGTYKGVRKMISSHGIVDTFLGLPYARPPVGQLRFEKPQPMFASKSVQDASKFGNECHQMSFPGYTPPKVGDTALPQDEDCLYLNVYKPVTGKSDLLPVMVWIHGGGYVLGAGSQYEGSNLAGNGIIVVTINYRLDVFGYLSTEDDAIPGNYGMLDQIMALKWIKENIKQFGGDPDQVTIFGESAGSASVSLLLLSPMSIGLFKRAIMESGSSLSPFAINRPLTRVTPHQIASLISSAVGCVDGNTVKMLGCLRGVDAEKLRNASERISTTFDYEVSVAPVVEKKFGFLPDLPLHIWTQNKFNHVDTLRGFNQAENGELFGTDYLNVTNATFVEEIGNAFRPYAILDKDRIIQQMLTAYVGKEDQAKEILLDLIQATSDFEFVGPALIEANIESKLAQEKKHYVYQFAHKSGLSPNPQWVPATHTEELPFVFGVDLKEFHSNGMTPTATDKMVSKQIQILWTNFAKFGDPTKTIPPGAVKWDPYVHDSAKILQIRNSSVMLNYGNTVAANITYQILRQLDTNLPDDWIVG